MQYPEEDAFAPKLHDLYIHADTYLPVATYLWLPAGKDQLLRNNRSLDAMYAYDEMNTDAQLNDKDFALDLNAVPSTRSNTDSDL